MAATEPAIGGLVLLAAGTEPLQWGAVRQMRYLASLNPATAAASELVLQGGRDYQVTVEGDLASWQAALAGRPDVTVRTYPADNHFFFPGRGPSTPAESEPAQHVDPVVISDMADWLIGVGHGPGSWPSP